MGNYYQPEIETMPVEQILALQSERLIKQVRYVYDHVKFYHDKMDEIGVMPDDIHGVEDLHKLPFITKDDLRDQYPYGLLAVPLTDCVRIQSTSGTTGRRVVAFYTQEDIDIWEDCCARAVMAAGGGKGCSEGSPPRACRAEGPEPPDWFVSVSGADRRRQNGAFQSIG